MGTFEEQVETLRLAQWVSEAAFLMAIFAQLLGLSLTVGLV